MARARNIKPGFFKNEQLVELPYEYRLLFAGLWTLADREGYLEDRPKRIKMEIFPGDDVNVEKGLSALESHGLILRYMVGEGRYIHICKFLEHQHPHHKEPASTLPKPGASPGLDADATRVEPEIAAPCNSVEPGASPGQARGKPGSDPSDSLNLIPDSIKNTSSARADMPAGFLRFWSAWPKSDRKVAKAECEKRWRSRGLEADADRIVAHVEAMSRSKQWRDGFEPAPLTFLNQRRWEDAAQSPHAGRPEWWLRAGYGDEASARADGVTEATDQVRGKAHRTDEKGPRSDGQGSDGVRIPSGTFEGSDGPFFDLRGAA